MDSAGKILIVFSQGNMKLSYRLLVIGFGGRYFCPADFVLGTWDFVLLLVGLEIQVIVLAAAGVEA